VVHPVVGGIERHILTKLLVSMLPTVVLALLAKKPLEYYLDNPLGIAAALILGAGAMEWIDRRFRRESPMRLEDITLRQAFWIGVIQCVSMWPGISRSGATIMGGMALGLTPRVAAEYSFYLAIPTMLAASAKTLWSEWHKLSTDGLAVVIAGSGTSFVVALLVIGPFLEFVKRFRFTLFAGYRVLLGLAVLAVYFAAR
jgi:undecaprenyl-diphosphatase